LQRLSLLEDECGSDRRLLCLASAVYILADDQIRLELPRKGHCISGH
jgi:hypothetical protein